VKEIQKNIFQEDDFLSLHKKATVVDLHTHPLLNMWFLGKDLSKRHWPPLFYNPFLNHVDLPRAKEGGVDVLFSIIYSPPNPFTRRSHTDTCLAMMDRMTRFVQANNDEVVLARGVKDIEQINKAGRIAIIHAIEGGHAIGADLGNLQRFYNGGVRYMTLTHFINNGIAAAAAHPFRPYDGLTDFGREVVREMNKLGMLIDTAHCSEKAFWDVIELGEASVVATHSGVRELALVLFKERNLSDDQIRAIADKGGLIGVIFCPWYLKRWGLFSKIDVLIDNMKYIADRIGVEHIALGSDMDGWLWNVRGIRDIRDLPKITQALLINGFTQQEILNIMGGNFIRVLTEVENAAK
jgi:membrane dipeptidase